MSRSKVLYLLGSNIAVIAGMGGLATALALAKEGFTNIEVYETASDLGFVGAGIQLAPNMARILDRLGVWEPIAQDATKMDGASIRSESFMDDGCPITRNELTWYNLLSRGPNKRGARLFKYDVDPGSLWLSAHGWPPRISGRRDL